MQSSTQMSLQQSNNQVRTALDVMNKSHESIRSMVPVPRQNETNYISNDPSRVGASAAEFAAASRASQSRNSAETTEIGSKGQHPNMYRASHNRRDNYLTTLLSNRVSEKTNVLSKMQQQQPLKVTINEQVQDMQYFGNLTGQLTLGAKAASINSSEGAVNTIEAGRIQLSSVDLKMIKNSFENTSMRLASGGGQGHGLERLESSGDKQQNQSKASIIALTQYEK